MLAYGYISEIDAAKGLVRVKFPDRDGIVSNWLPVSVPFTLDNKAEFWPKVNQNVWCVMDADFENGVCAGSIYDAENEPEIGDENIQAVTFSDGTQVKYDIENSVLTIDCAGDVIVKASGDITLDNGEVTVKGDLIVEGGILAEGDIMTESEMIADGDIESQQNIKAGINVEANVEVTALASGPGVNLSTHVHPYVDTPVGAATTSPPTPGT